MGVAKDIFDIAVERTPIGKWLNRFNDRGKRERLLESFCPDFRRHSEDETQVEDYYRWNDEASLWTIGDGDLYGTSYRELAAFWSNPKLYSIYEGTLLRYIRAGGDVHRTVVVGEEYFDRSLQLLLVRTGTRQSILGFEPTVVHKLDIAAAQHRLGIDCDMLSIVNNRIAYFIRIAPVPVLVRTTNRKCISRVWKTYRDISRSAMPFQDWLGQHSLTDQVREMLPEIEEEARLITAFVDGCRTEPLKSAAKSQNGRSVKGRRTKS